MAEGVGNAPTSAMPILFSRQVQPAYICLPSRKVDGWEWKVESGAQGASVFLHQLSTMNSQPRLAARVGLAPTPNGLTGRRATLTPPGNGAAGRIFTCIVPFRRRMPHVFGHDSNRKWSERQDFHLRPRGPKPRALKTELRSEKMADPNPAAAGLNPPADNGALC